MLTWNSSRPVLCGLVILADRSNPPKLSTKVRVCVSNWDKRRNQGIINHQSSIASMVSGRANGNNDRWGFLSHITTYALRSFSFLFVNTFTSKLNSWEAFRSAAVVTGDVSPPPPRYKHAFTIITPSHFRLRNN